MSTAKSKAFGVALLALAATVAGCGSSDNKTVILVKVTAQPALETTTGITVQVGSITRDFDGVALGTSEAKSFGIFSNDLTGVQTVVVVAKTPGTCPTSRGEASVTIPTKSGETVPVDVVVKPNCGNDGDAGTKPDAGVKADVAVVVPDAGTQIDGPTTPVDAPMMPKDTAALPDMAPLPVDTSPAVLPNPPSLTKCTEYQHGADKCEEGGVGDWPVWSVAFSPDGKLAASAGADGRIKLWKVTATGLESDGRIIATQGQARIAFSPDSKMLAIGADQGQLFFHDLVLGARRALTGHTGRVRGVAFSSDGSRMVSVDAMGSLRTWNTETASAVGLPIALGANNTPWGLAVSPTNAAGELWAAVIMTYKLPDGVDAGASMIPGSNVYLVNVNDPTKNKTLLVEAGDVDGSAVAISPDGRLLAAGSEDSVVHFWDITNRNAPVVLGALPESRSPLPQDEAQEAVSVAFRADGKYLAVAHGGSFVGGRVRVADVATRMIRSEHVPQSFYTISVAFSPSGDAVLAGEVACTTLIYCRD